MKENKNEDKADGASELNSDNSSNGPAKSDVIEIPVGKYFGKMRSNPWIMVSVVLAFLLIFVIFFNGFSGFGLTGNVVNEKTAGDNLISFINSQGNGDAKLTSIDKDDGFYKAVVNYQGQDIPVFLSLDGKYLLGDRIPLAGTNLTGVDAGTDNIDTTPVQVNVGDSPVKGNQSAPVTIVEFTDYQCPFCGKFFQESYSQIVKDYVDTGKVKIVVMDFPLTEIHPYAQKASEAALCVREQKADAGYFKMHDKMFSNQDKLTIDDLKAYAKGLGVNVAKFDDCLDSGKYAQTVKDNQDYGVTLGITGTPTFFVNGIKLVGALPYSQFQSAIDAQLANLGA